MPATQKQRAILLALAALGAALLAAPAARAADAHYEGISEDGLVAAFSTSDRLVSGDTDIEPDVYVRELDLELGWVTRKASLGPTGGNDAYPAQFLAIDPAGDKVFFSTKERLTAEDTDSAEDIYVRDLVSNETKLVSAGDASCAASGCGNANIDAGAVPEGVVDEGNKVFFVSSERLSPADTDNAPDVYMRDLATERTILVSRGAASCAPSCGNGSQRADFRGAAADGSKAIFTTAESLSGEDEDGETDLYERDLEAGGGSGETKLVSTPGPGPEACPAGHNCEPSTSAISANGAHVFFETNEQISGEDTDHAQDVYDWSGGGTATLVSIGPTGGNGTANALLAGSSANGEDVFFTTDEQLVGTDTDSAEDVYVRRGGETELVSEGDPACQPGCGNGALPTSLSWVSADGSLAVLTTAEPLSSDDTDASADVYARTLPGGTTTLVSVPGPTCSDLLCGNEENDASFAGAAAEGASLFFVTDEALAPPETEDPFEFGDRDTQTDVYEWNEGTTSLISAGQEIEGIYRGNNSLFPAQLRGVSEDGAKAVFTSKERLTEADEDADEDVYMRWGANTLLISRGNDAILEAELAPPGPSLKRTDPESPNSATSLKVIGSEPGGSGFVKLYATANCSGEPVAIGSAAQLEAPGLAVSVAVGSTTTFYATAEAEGFVSPCSGGLTYRQQSPESSPGGSAPVPGPGTGAPRLEVPKGPTYLVPRARITFGPAFKTRARRPVFRFADATGQPGTSFACKVDRHAWKGCSSPVKLRKLGPGRHVFEVRGVNAIGVAQPQPAKRGFKLVRRR
jgi:hypothetical protein